MVHAGCLNRELKPLTPCTTSGVVENVKVESVDKVDLAFIVDGSASMADEIKLLGVQLPRLVQILASGDVDNDGVQEFPPVKDMHLGVITVDMGTNGADAAKLVADPNCTGETDEQRTVTLQGGQEAGLGEDGVLWNHPNKGRLGGGGTNEPLAYPECANVPDPGPLYETYTPPADSSDKTAVETKARAVAEKFGCTQKLIYKRVPSGNSNPTNVGGKKSCGFEQQLEAMLKAAWPSDDASYTFFAGTKGHSGAENADFFRPDALWVMLMVTDEEDCSAYKYEPPPVGPFIKSGNTLQILCQRAAAEEENGNTNSPLNPIQRYVDGLLKLRPDPDLLVFAAITGLPIGADAERLYSDPFNIDFDGILKHPSMQYGEELLCEKGDTNCSEANKFFWPRPACRIGDRETASADAGPGRRYVRIAKELEARGSNGVVYPICVTDSGDPNDPRAGFRPAIDAVIQKVADSLGAVCLPRPRIKGPDNLVSCDVLETLPPKITGSDRVTRCADLANKGREAEPVRIEKVKLNGVDVDREVCRVRQLPSVAASESAVCNPQTGDNCGWFYDDFTGGAAGVKEACKPTANRDGSQRILFSEGSKSGSGATVRFECVDRIQAVPSLGVGLGSTCVTEGEGPKCDQPYFCEPRSKSCQQRCASPAECPSGYTCDLELTEPLCINPTCS